MELLLINKNKLKIILTEKDLDSYGLTAFDFDYSDTGTRKALWDIFDRAKRTTGFDAASDKIYIQVFCSAYGGCEMFVTKPAERKVEDEVSFQIEKENYYYRVYSFNSLQNLISLCKNPSMRELSCQSSVYSGEETYYLVLKSEQKPSDSNEYALIGDYCTKREKDDLIYYIKEHCTPICISDAIEVLSPL